LQTGGYFNIFSKKSQQKIFAAASGRTAKCAWLTCQVGGVGFVFVPKCVFPITGQHFGVAIFPLLNYLLIGQLRRKAAKWAGVDFKLVYSLRIFIV